MRVRFHDSILRRAANKYCTNSSPQSSKQAEALRPMKRFEKSDLQSFEEQRLEQNFRIQDTTSATIFLVRKDEGEKILSSSSSSSSSSSVAAAAATMKVGISIVNEQAHSLILIEFECSKISDLRSILQSIINTYQVNEVLLPEFQPSFLVDEEVQDECLRQRVNEWKAQTNEHYERLRLRRVHALDLDDELQ